jgi:hypothetical protein
VIQARRLEIVNRYGRAKITLESQPILGGILTLYDHSGDIAIEAVALNNGYPMIRMFGPGGHNGITLGVMPGSGPDLTLYHMRKGPRVHLFVKEDSTAGLELFDLPALTPHEEETLDGYDLSDKKRIWMGLNSEGVPSLLMNDKDNKKIFQAPLSQSSPSP